MVYSEQSKRLSCYKIESNRSAMVLGIQLRKKWKREFLIEDLFSVQVLILQIGGHWPVDYSKILPRSWAFLSKYINYMVFSYVIFLSWHMSVLQFASFISDALSGETVQIMNLLDSVTSTVMYFYAGLSSFCLQYYHEECKAMLMRMIEKFRRRSARGE